VTERVNPSAPAATTAEPISVAQRITSLDTIRGIAIPGLLAP